jgi:hypothetical protein
MTELHQTVKLEFDSQRPAFEAALEATFQERIANLVAEQVHAHTVKDIKVGNASSSVADGQTEPEMDARVEALVNERLRELARGYTARGFDHAPVVPQPMRVMSKEPPRYSGVERGEPGAAWIRLMDAHLKLLCAADKNINEDLKVAIAISFMEDKAHRFACLLRTEFENGLTWDELSKQLMERFGVQRAAYQLLQDLRVVKQGTLSVAEFTNEFEARLDPLIIAGSADALTIVSFFLEGLNKVLHAAVTRSFVYQAGTPMEEYVKMKPRGAVRALSKLAQKCEEVEDFLAPPRVDLRANVAAYSSGEARATVVFSNGPPRFGRGEVRPAARFARSAQRGRPEQTFSRAEVITHLSRKHGVPEEIVDQRLRANLCAACASNEHIARECKQPVVQQATNSKAH